MGKFFGFVNENYVATLLEEQLKAPGDFVIFHTEKQPTFYTVGYRRNILPQGKDSMRIAPAHLRNSTVRIPVAEVKKKWQQNPMQKLIAHVRSKLLEIIAWDFDETLSAFHIWPGYSQHKTTPVKNMRFPEQTKAVLAGLVTLPYVRQVIISNSVKSDTEIKALQFPSYHPTIMKYIDAWYPQTESKPPFYQIYGRKAKQSTPQHKIEYFRQCYDELLANKVITDGGIVSLDSDAPWDVVSCMMIDDTKVLKNKQGDIARNIEQLFLQHGIDFLYANPKTSQHLVDIEKQYQLGLDLKPLTFNFQDYVTSEKENLYGSQDSSNHLLWMSASTDKGLDSASQSLEDSVESLRDSTNSLRQSR